MAKHPALRDAMLIGGESLERLAFFALLLFVNAMQLHTLLSQAIELVEEDKPLHAVQLLQRIIAEQPACERAYVLLVEIYVQWGQHEAVRNVLVRGLRHNRGSAELMRQLGLHFMRVDEYEKALRCFLKIRHVKDAGLHRTLGVLYAFMGKHHEAVQELKHAAQLDPRLPKAFELWAKELLVLNKPDDAIAILKRALVVEPYSSLAHRLLGDAYASKRRWKSAYHHYVLAADMDPDDNDAWLGIARALAGSGRFEEARHYCEHVVRVQPQNIQALVLLQRICTKLDNHRKSRRFSPSTGSISGRDYN
jgi:tetratricopeptide (TPR) repeat protein